MNEVNAKEKGNKQDMQTMHDTKGSGVIGHLPCPVCGAPDQVVKDDGRKCYLICDHCEVQTLWQRRSARDRIRAQLQAAPSPIDESMHSNASLSMKEDKTVDALPIDKPNAASEKTPFFTFFDD